jgi:hypothetical protein
MLNLKGYQKEEPTTRNMNSDNWTTFPQTVHTGTGCHLPSDYSCIQSETDDSFVYKYILQTQNFTQTLMIETGRDSL